MNDKASSKFQYSKPKKNHYLPNDEKSYQTKSSDKSYTKSQQSSAYTFRSDVKSSHSQQKNDKTTKQAQPRSVYKYKIERDKSGNCSYVLEEPIHNPIKVINNYEIKCIYPNSGTKYYKNVNIYNYKKKIII